MIINLFKRDKFMWSYEKWNVQLRDESDPLAIGRHSNPAHIKRPN